MERLASFLPPYVATRTTVHCLIVLLTFLAAIASVSLGFEIAEIRLLTGMRRNLQVADEVFWAHALLREVLSIGLGASAATSALTFIAWLHRVRINARAFGSRRFRYSRVWVPIGFLIPGLNFFRPFQVVSEIWRASDPRAIETPLEWKTARLSPLVPSWWAALVVSVLLQLLVIATIRSAGAAVEVLWTARCLGAAADLATVVAAFSTCLLVTSIERAQTRKWTLLNRSNPGGDPPRDRPQRTRIAPEAVGA